MEIPGIPSWIIVPRFDKIIHDSKSGNKGVSGGSRFDQPMDSHLNKVRGDMTGNDQDQQIIQVNLGPRSYPIAVVDASRLPASGFADFIRACLGRTWAGQGCEKALVVADSNVRQAWAEPVADALKAIGLQVAIAEVAAGESSKSLAALSSLFDSLMDLQADRHTLVVAVGGGVIGDLAGFAAASFNRGLPLVMIPTTLLAQVDSSVGGKTGVNHPRGKNLIGAFHQPIGVWIDVTTQSSLPEREFRSGLAEVVKYGVIQDPEFFQYLEANAAAALQRDSAVLTHLVARSCRLKADVVEQDELEQTGLRAILNFGHTVAHAIENVAGYGQYLHGEAVSIGMLAEMRLAEKLGWVDAALVARLESLLKQLQLPVRMANLNLDSLMAAMKHDKKNRSGRVRFVLPQRLGKMAMTNMATDDQIRAVLQSLAD